MNNTLIRMYFEKKYQHQAILIIRVDGNHKKVTIYQSKVAILIHEVLRK